MSSAATINLPGAGRNRKVGEGVFWPGRRGSGDPGEVGGERREILRILGRVEPEAEVKRVQRVGHRIDARVRKRVVVHQRSRHRGSLRDDEGLFVETADEASVTFAVVISLDISLIPGQSERRRDLARIEPVFLEPTTKSQTYRSAVSLKI